MSRYEKAMRLAMITAAIKTLKQMQEDAVEELCELEKQRQEEWWHNEDQDGRYVEENW